MSVDQYKGYTNSSTFDDQGGAIFTAQGGKSSDWGNIISNDYRPSLEDAESESE